MSFNIEAVENYYKEAPTLELIEIAQNPHTLRKEIIPVLQRELLVRNENEAALGLSEFLVQQNEPKLETPEQIDAYIQKRLDSGAPLENIRIDLKEKGVTSFGILEQNEVKQEAIIDYVSTLKEQGATNAEIIEKLETNLDIKPEELTVIQAKMYKKGTLNLVIGYTIVILLGGLGLVTLMVGRGMSIASIILIGIGLWRITEGYKLRKNSGQV
jgi:hypothetical protein